MITHATRYAESGYAIFPLQPREKTPLIKDWRNRATNEMTTIREWWGQWPAANIGLPTGAVNRLWTLDVDGPEGAKTMRALQQEHGDLPKGSRMYTGKGQQSFFQWDDLRSIGNTVGKIGPSVDTRGQGGYTILPPSVHPSGKTYTWRDLPKGALMPTVLSAPDWLVNLIRSPQARTPESAGPLSTDQLCAVAPEGARNASLARMVGRVFNITDPPEDLELATAIMRWWNAACCMPPLDEEEVERTVLSVLGTRMRQRAEAFEALVIDMSGVEYVEGDEAPPGARGD